MLPANRSTKDIIGIYAGSVKDENIPLYDANSKQYLYYKVDGSQIDIFKKYRGTPPEPGQYDFKTNVMATAVFLFENGAFSNLTIVLN